MDSSYMRSKIPLKLVLILAVALILNSLLVIGFQMLVSYRYSGPVDEALLGKMDKAYENCTIIDSTNNKADQHSSLTVYLVQTADGQHHLVTVQDYFLANRCRLVKKASQPLESGAQTVRLRAGSYTLYIGVRENESGQAADIWLDMLTGPGQTNMTRLRNSLILWNVPLCALELIAYSLIFKKEEIA